MQRRKLLSLAAGCALPVLGGAPAFAQGGAQGPVTIVVPYAPGGATDTIARLLARKLSESGPRTYVVANKPGGGTSVGAVAVARSRADGDTLLYATSTTLAINASLFQHLSYKPLEDFAPVSLVAETPMFVVVGTGLGLDSMAELVAYARKNPGKLSFGSAGTGSPHHLVGEMIKAGTGTFITHIPYRGSSPALNDLLGGVIPLLIAELSVIQPHLEGGRLKVLAVASAKRLPSAPDVPTQAETKVPGLEDIVATPWHGIVAPAATPPAVVAALNQQIVEAMADAQIRQRIQQLGGSTVTTTPEAFRKMLPAETERWARAVRFSGARAD